ncbi:ABC transporter substrate-binding protein [Cohnella herbarum]|uniref:Carbohydrate ABC transporter substrate-binding protein n=1 Tax=Cohnella herbarum TaxID=2728023 RepID=A0A7Z2ZPA6_9BACL|nr:ABC transporter substrate-binding protein [Cohnella herbarum]QJD86959.1 carbohydrate ABC transporter substrate-binding protein [Cohnella herbarum]
MTRRNGWCLSLLVALAVSLSACGGTNPSNPSRSGKPQVTLTLMGNQEWVQKPIIVRAIELYEKQTGNRVEVQAFPIDTVDTLIRKRVAMGEISDIVIHFGGAGLSDLQPENNFADMSGERWVADLKPAIVPRLTYKDKIYGLPLWESSIGGMLYNKEIFEKYDIPVPTNQAEFFDACERLKKVGIIPVYLASKDTWPLLPQYGIDFLVSKVPDLVESLNSNRIRFADIPEFRRMLEWYMRMKDGGYFGKNVLNNNWDSQPAALANGKYAMAMAWDVYLYTDLEKKFPGTADKFGIMPNFMGGPDAKQFEGPNAAMLMVNKNGQHLQDAKAFIDFVSQPEILNEIYRDLYTETYFASVTSNKLTKQYEEAKSLIDKYLYPSVTPFIVGYSQNEMGKLVQQMMIGSLSIDEAIAKMDDNRVQAAKQRGIPGF